MTSARARTDRLEDRVVLITGAAVAALARDASLETFQRILSIDVLGLFAVTQQAGERMITAGCPRL